jgi:hypothetical protein
MLALTGQHFIIDYNERMGTLPGFVDGFTKVARDEHRHVAFGARFLRDMTRREPRYGEAIQRALVEVAPAADGVLRPSCIAEGDEDTVIPGSAGRRHTLVEPVPSPRRPRTPLTPPPPRRQDRRPSALH